MSIDKRISHSEQETENFAAEIAAAHPHGAVIALFGDLGAGKTVFARGFARALGITEPVSSPTYTIIQEYPRPQGGWFYHLDLYRIANSASALAFGVDEYLAGNGDYALVEWPERIADILPPDTLRITIRHLPQEGTREITVG